ncbi:MAG: DISARM system phospholipase D-like protein DrmC [Terriglobales bacterium]|jgi:phosphatidylserine/phosphatidylglycerophosphate/cardiolipin synthase-like enzyme
MISPALTRDIDSLIRRAHQDWLQAVCSHFGSVPQSINSTSLIAELPTTNNSDVAHCLANIIRQAEGVLSWRALGASIEVCASVFSYWHQQHNIELLWTGPSPASQIPARRIDQVLYDLIDCAKRDILLVTFAAHKISRLTDGLVRALNRSVHVKLILEFEETSQGQLSMDALSAFPDVIRQRAQIYYWPLDNRERNSYGKPGKLHAKAAVIDEQVVLSSANLTDDAFNRNLELGVLFSNDEIRQRLRDHCDSLCADGILRLFRS